VSEETGTVLGVQFTKIDKSAVEAGLRKELESIHVQLAAARERLNKSREALGRQ
jgi:hypothetical protein